MGGPWSCLVEDHSSAFTFKFLASSLCLCLNHSVCLVSWNQNIRQKSKPFFFFLLVFMGAFQRQSFLLSKEAGVVRRDCFASGLFQLQAHRSVSLALMITQRRLLKSFLCLRRDAIMMTSWVQSWFSLLKSLISNKESNQSPSASTSLSLCQNGSCIKIIHRKTLPPTHIQPSNTNSS